MTPDEILKLFAAAGVLLTIFVSLFTASQSASKNGFQELKEVVEILKQDIKGLKEENQRKEFELEKLRERVDVLEAENQMLREENMRLKTRPTRGNGFGLKS